jgi:hypothetical protein
VGCGILMLVYNSLTTLQKADFASGIPSEFA